MKTDDYANVAAVLLVIITIIHAFDFYTRLNSWSYYMPGEFREALAPDIYAMFTISMGIMVLLMVALFFFATRKGIGLYLALVMGAVDLIYVAMAMVELMPDVNMPVAAVLLLLPAAMMACAWKSKPLFGAAKAG